VVSYLVGNQPSQTAKMMMKSVPEKKVGHREAEHGEERAALVEDRILAVGGIDADGQRDQDADQIGGADHDHGLRQALADDGEDGAARLPGQDALFALDEMGAEPAVEQRGGLDPEELAEPEEVAHEDRLVGAKRLDHLLPDVGRHGQRNFGHGRAGGEVHQQEDHQADDQKRRDGQQKPAKREGEHGGSVPCCRKKEGAGPDHRPREVSVTSRGTSPRRSTTPSPRR
jgi:hypothetical protein